MFRLAADPAHRGCAAIIRSACRPSGDTLHDGRGLPPQALDARSRPSDARLRSDLRTPARNVHLVSKHSGAERGSEQQLITR